MKLNRSGANKEAELEVYAVCM